jgi:ribonuclease P protein component
VLGRGTRVRSVYLDIAWMINSAGHPRLGLVVPKFQSNAVARNRLRRRLKELWRRQGLSKTGSIDVVFRAKPEAYRAEFRDLARVVEDWFKTVSGTLR